jgi:hypothetical protein
MSVRCTTAEHNSGTQRQDEFELNVASRQRSVSLCSSTDRNEVKEHELIELITEGRQECAIHFAVAEMRIDTAWRLERMMFDPQCLAPEAVTLHHHAYLLTQDDHRRGDGQIQLTDDPRVPARETRLMSEVEQRVRRFERYLLRALDRCPRGFRCPCRSRCLLLPGSRFRCRPGSGRLSPGSDRAAEGAV